MGNTIKRFENGQWVDYAPPEYNGGWQPTGPSGPASFGMSMGFAPTLVHPSAAVAPAATPAVAPDMASGMSGQISDLLTKPGAQSAPAANPFADTMQKYIGQGAPQAPGANPFADATQQYLSSPAPQAPGQAKMADNRFAGELSAAERRLQDLITNPASLESSSSYKFRVQQGQEALQRSMGARGLLNSGNRLMDLTKYGQDMGSQEYEAENARRMALLNSYAGNYNTDQANNVNLLGVQQGSMDKQYGTAADLYKARGGTLADLYRGADATGMQRYGVDTQASTARGGMLADLYRGADTTGTQRYSIDTTANTARANTLADLYRTDVGARTAQLPYQQQPFAPKPWWQQPARA